MAESEDRSPLDLLCDLLVYAPLGFVFEAPKLLPELATRGRDQVATARSVGQLVVRQAGTRLGPLVGGLLGSVLGGRGGDEPTAKAAPRTAAPRPTSSARSSSPTDSAESGPAEADSLQTESAETDSTEAAVPVTDPADAGSAVAEPPAGGSGSATPGEPAGNGLSPTGQAALSEEMDPPDLRDAVAESATDASAEAARGAAPPADALAIPHYDSLAASQVVPRLDALSPQELALVRAYESTERGRRTILNRIDQLLEQPPRTGQLNVVDAARPATPADLERLVELCHLAREELAPQRGGWIWARREARPEPFAESLAQALQSADACVVVGTVMDYVAGYAVLRVEALRDGSLLGVAEDLYTEAAFRAVGVGEAMMDQLVAFCRDRGCVGIDSFALPGDRETKNFFESFGLKARGLLVHRSFLEVGVSPGSAEPAETAAPQAPNDTGTQESDG